ncbi:MAG: LuxR C-terminal-related transcriptional regulator [Arthrobacter oryzae]
MARPADSTALIERDGVVSGALDSLRSGTGSGVLIIGPAGTGRTAIVKAVLRELGQGEHFIRLTATRTLASVPFGALAPYLGNVPVRDLDSYAAVLAGITESLRSEAQPPLFVIDDAHCLDRSTAQVLARAAATGVAGLMATSLPGSLIPEDFLTLWDDGLLAKFTLSPLSPGGTHQLCEQILRSDVSPWVSRWLHTAAAGNPLMLMSLIRHARDSGVLGWRHGAWFLLSNPALAQVPASDVLYQQLRSMAPEARTAATIVALAGPLPLSQVLRFSGSRAVDALDLAGIIAVTAGTDREVRPASSMVGEIIRQRVPAARSSMLRANILGLFRADDVRPEARLNRLRWSLDCGAAIPPGQLVQAAEAANTALDPETALRAAAAVNDALFLPEARIQLAYSNYLLGRMDAAAGHLEDALPLHHGRAVYLAALLADRLRHATSEPRTQAKACGTVSGGAGRSPGLSLAGTPWTSLPAAGIAADMLLRGRDGRFPAVAAGLRELAEASRSVPEICLPALSQLAELLTAQGRMVSGLQLDEEAWLGASAACRALPLVYEEMVFRHCLNLSRAGCWIEVAAVLDDYAAQQPGRLLFSGGMLHLVRGYARLRQGRMRDSLAELRWADEELLIADPLILRPFALALAAYAARCAGNPDAAHKYVVAYGRSGCGEPRTLRLLADAYCHAAGPVPGPSRSAGAGLLQLAREADHEGLAGVEADIRRLAVRCGDTGQAAALAACSNRVEGAEARLLSSYATAVAAADAGGLINLSDDALGAGHLLLSLEAAEQAGRLVEKTPERWKQTAVQRRVHHRLVEAGTTAHLHLVPGTAGTALTGREEEIRDLVTGGATNAEIAAVLGVSPRTVAGHLSHILAKLGVRRRTELSGEPALRS